VILDELSNVRFKERKAGRIVGARSQFTGNGRLSIRSVLEGAPTPAPPGEIGTAFLSGPAQAEQMTFPEVEEGAPLHEHRGRYK